MELETSGRLLSCARPLSPFTACSGVVFTVQNLMTSQPAKAHTSRHRPEYRDTSVRGANHHLLEECSQAKMSQVNTLIPHRLIHQYFDSYRSLKSLSVLTAQSRPSAVGIGGHD